MMLSDDKVSHLSHIIVTGLKSKKLVKLIAEEPAIRKAVKNVITTHLSVWQDVDEVVRKKVKSLKKGLTEGTQEWDIMYRKFFEEESARRGGIVS
ncbi:MAG: DUF507 family protein [Nitrospirae bacterium]|nr:DUF507 family protein [Nitrospirota bacterium]MBF0519990.1 DUF507 family protein [Nitrospirota bacterium]MBF0536403.1 DUF507 family protein [Nitrospirota bacterium]MBF0618325.1 DUF507 family protein [Nitrospirota bacterium]